MKNKIIELRKNGLTINQIVEELNCAKSTVSYHINKVGLGRKTITNDLIRKMNEYYLTHSKVQTAKYFDVSVSSVTKYCANKRVNLTNDERRKNRVIAVSNRRRKIKQMAVEYKGGKCTKCGYNKYVGALEFHHLDPTQKDFSVSAKGHCTSWEKVKIELDKCILVCSNCHKEIHGDIE